MNAQTFTTAQILELTEIVTGSPAGRTATKAKAVERLTRAAEAEGLDCERTFGGTFEEAKAILLGAPEEEPLPESQVQKRLDAVKPGAGGPGLTRFRNHPEYQAIIAKTNEDAEAAAALGVPAAQPKKEKPAKKAKPAAPKKEGAAPRVVISEDHVITEVQENPKRPGTKAHAIFSLYRKDMTTAAFIAACEKAGYTKADAKSNLSWDRRKGFITIYP